MKTYRLKQSTEPTDTFIPFELNRDIDVLQILSLNINQESLYQTYNSNYGVLLGRIISNGGFGIPNAKISIFIPLDENDDPISKKLYPYKNINDKDEKGYRYNLLREDSESNDNSYYTPTGSFKKKRRLLDNKEYIKIYKKYYIHTTSTNHAGDYMITNIPTGNKIVHVDVDLSDLDFYSLRPYELVANGMSEKVFKSFSRFSKSVDLDSLPQIHSVNINKEILPFWGEGDNVGINRLDIDLPLNITPSALITFGTFTDSSKGVIGASCRPRKKTGKNCELVTSPGSINIIRRVSNNSNQIEELTLNSYQIDNNGAAVFAIPMNLDRKITDEYGNLISSPNSAYGIPTSANIRMKVSLNDSNGLSSKTASYLIPNLNNNFLFDENTKDEDFFKLKWKKIYTVKNYIPRFQPNSNQGNLNFIGLKDLGICEENLAIPYNRISSSFNILYTILCILIDVLVAIFVVIDTISFGSLKFRCDGIEYSSATDWRDECVMPKIADFFNVVSYEFYNDFLVGSLYFPKFKIKTKYKRRKEVIYHRYCAYNCRDYVNSSNVSYINRCKDNFIVDRDDFNSSPSYFVTNEATRQTNRGLIVEYLGEFFYPSRNDTNINPDNYSTINLTPDQTDKNRLLFATDFQILGSSVDCDIDGDPKIYEQLVPSSYYENDTYGYLFTLDDFGDCIKPSNINDNRIYNISTVGVNVIGGEEDNFNEDEFYIDKEDIILRKYLTDNFNTYSNNEYSNNEINITDNDGQDILINEDSTSLTSNNPIRNTSNFHHYFGLKNGKTAIDILLNTFLKN